MKLSSIAFVATAVLWVIWGLVHVFAGVMTMAQPTPLAIAGIADAVDSATITAHTFPDAAGAIVNQHGWNLAWIGLTTIVVSWGAGRGKLWALAVAALVGGMADLGYFLFMDLGGFVHFVPGTVMTLVSGSAIVLSVVGYALRRADR